MDEKTLIALIKGELEATFKELEQQKSEIEEAQSEGEFLKESQQETVEVVRRESTTSKVQQSAKMATVPKVPSIEVIEAEESLDEVLLSVCAGEYFLDVEDLLAETVSWSFTTNSILLIAKRTGIVLEVPIGVLALVIRRLWDFSALNDALATWLEENDIPEVSGTPDPSTMECVGTCPDRIVAVINFNAPYLVLKKGKDCLVISPEDLSVAFKLLKSRASEPSILEVLDKAGFLL